MKLSRRTARGAWNKAGVSRPRPITSVALVVSSVVAAACLGAAPASADSRGFVVKNDSSVTLRLESARHVHVTVCDWFDCRENVPLEMEFEGRPQDGTEIAPGDSQRWDLKYGFHPFALWATLYAARVTYKIEHTNARVVYTIETTPTTNNSTCEVVPADADAGFCTAGGLDLTYWNY